MSSVSEAPQDARPLLRTVRGCMVSRESRRRFRDNLGLPTYVRQRLPPLSHKNGRRKNPEVVPFPHEDHSTGINLSHGMPVYFVFRSAIWRQFAVLASSSTFWTMTSWTTLTVFFLFFGSGCVTSNLYI